MSPSKLPRVAVLMGGPDDEREISLISGRAVLGGLEEAGHDTDAVVLEPNGSWTFDGAGPHPFGEGLERLADRFDAAFVALHGPTGEGGFVQASLELARVPFTGSRMGASALAMDKSLSRLRFGQAGLTIAPGVDAHPGADADAIAGALGLPVFTKPNDSGSSYGIERVDSVEHLQRVLDATSIRLLVEAAIAGPELTVAVLERGERTDALPPVLIRPRGDAAFFTLEVKYDPDAVDEICPAPIDPAWTEALGEIGLRAHAALGCRDFSRTDVMWGPDGPVVLETNTIPGLTPASLFPKAAAAAGISFPELVSGLSCRAAERGR